MSDHFIGMTKATFTRLLVALLLATFCLHAYSLYQDREILHRLQTTHTALCALRQENTDSLAATIRARQHFSPGAGEAKLLDLLIASRARTAVALSHLDGSCPA